MTQTNALSFARKFARYLRNQDLIVCQPALELTHFKSLDPMPGPHQRSSHAFAPELLEHQPLRRSSKGGSSKIPLDPPKAADKQALLTDQGAAHRSRFADQ
jgi:hypothetical protein